MTKPRFGLLLFVLLSAFQAQAQDIPADFSVTLERTSCFGACAVYSVSIDATGAVLYDGLQNVRVQGLQTDSVSVAKVRALAEAVSRAQFFSLNDSYKSIQNPDGTSSVVSDLPTAYVKVVQGGRTKRIEDYLGAPETLRSLESLIDDVARTKRWLRLDAAAVNAMVRGGWTPTDAERAEHLDTALSHDDVDAIRALLEIGADPNHLYYGTGSTALMMVRSADAARALLDAGANVNAVNESGETALGHTAYLPADVTKVLIERGARPDLSSQTPALWQAACAGNAAVVRLLLAAGADPARGGHDSTPLDCARKGAAVADSKRFPEIFRQPFTEDFHGVERLLQEALAKRR